MVFEKPETGFIRNATLQTYWQIRGAAFLLGVLRKSLFYFFRGSFAPSLVQK